MSINIVVSKKERNYVDSLVKEKYDFDPQIFFDKGMFANIKSISKQREWNNEDLMCLKEKQPLNLPSDVYVPYDKRVTDDLQYIFIGQSSFNNKQPWSREIYVYLSLSKKTLLLIDAVCYKGGRVFVYTKEYKNELKALITDLNARIKDAEADASNDLYNFNSPEKPPTKARIESSIKQTIWQYMEAFDKQGEDEYFKLGEDHAQELIKLNAKLRTDQKAKKKKLIEDQFKACNFI